MSELTKIEIRALNEALDDEYHSWALYDQVIADFGAAPPFSNIRTVKARHIDALCVLFERYGLPIQKNTWPGKVIRYASRQATCEAGVAAEIANGEMYNRLIKVTERSDIRSVLFNLQEASQQRHLPAFQRSAQGSSAGDGQSMKHRHGGSDL